MTQESDKALVQKARDWLAREPDYTYTPYDLRSLTGLLREVAKEAKREARQEEREALRVGLRKLEQ